MVDLVASCDHCGADICLPRRVPQVMTCPVCRKPFPLTSAESERFATFGDYFFRPIVFWELLIGHALGLVFVLLFYAACGWVAGEGARLTGRRGSWLWAMGGVAAGIAVTVLAGYLLMTSAPEDRRYTFLVGELLVWGIFGVVCYVRQRRRIVVARS